MMTEPDAAGARSPSAADDELSPQESLDVIEAQQAAAARGLSFDPVPMFASWGTADLLGFGAFYVASSPARWHFLPLWAAALVLGALALAATVVVGAQIARRSRGVRGPSRTVIAAYGWTWLLSFAGVLALNIGLSWHGLPAALQPLLWPGTCTVVAGVLYLAGGLLFGDRVQYGLGAWMLAVGAGSVLAGWPANFAVLALAGGGGFLAAAGFARARARAGRRRARAER